MNKIVNQPKEERLGDVSVELGNGVMSIELIKNIDDPEYPQYAIRLYSWKLGGPSMTIDMSIDGMTEDYDTDKPVGADFFAKVGKMFTTQAIRMEHEARLKKSKEK